MSGVAAAPDSALLRVRELRVRYGGIQALQGISIDVALGEIVAVLGANGAGKSTLLRAISGLIHPYAGTIVFEGTDVTRVRPAAIAAARIALVPEGRQVFGRLTVLDNLRLGAIADRSSRNRSSELENVFGIFPRLAERRDQLAGTLSGGEQQMLAIGRALMARPLLMMLDEPSMGLSPKMVDVIYDVLGKIGSSTSILLVEQNVGAALELASRGYVLQTGNVAISGPASQLSQGAIRAAYLGEE